VSPVIKLIVCLGNPGPEYALTRHNAGYWFADVLAGKYALNFRRQAKFNSAICRLSLSGSDCILCKPQTSMNLSGDTLQAITSFYRITSGEILVVHDEIDLPPGVIRLKKGGGHGGHNGLRDIIEKLGNGDFNRLRIGVGHPGASNQVIDYVLRRPSADDETLIMQAIATVIDRITDIVAGEIQKVMNKLHRSTKLKVKS
jgi:peptidyl-tRNA hydrolase